NQLMSSVYLDWDMQDLRNRGVQESNIDYIQILLLFLLNSHFLKMHLLYLRLQALVLDQVCLVSGSEEHTSELQSRFDLVCRLLLTTASTHTITLSLHDALPISN